MDPYTWGRGITKRVQTRDIPDAVKRLVDKRQGGRHCVHCKAMGLETPPGVQLQLDHRQELAKGGDHHHLNLQWLCSAHNYGRRRGGKSTELRTPSWYYKHIPNY